MTYIARLCFYKALHSACVLAFAASLVVGMRAQTSNQASMGLYLPAVREDAAEYRGDEMSGSDNAGERTRKRQTHSHKVTPPPACLTYTWSLTFPSQADRMDAMPSFSDCAINKDDLHGIVRVWALISSLHDLLGLPSWSWAEFEADVSLSTLPYPSCLPSSPIVPVLQLFFCVNCR